MLILSGVNTLSKNTYTIKIKIIYKKIKYDIYGLVFLIYEDYKSIYYALKYLINIDFSKSERKALSSENLFKEKPLIKSCFFHFSQSIIKNMKKNKIMYKKLN